MNKDKKMDKKNIIILVLMAIIVALGASKVYLQYQEKNKEEKENLTEAEKFAKEYTQVGKDNVFVYRSAEDVIKVLEHGTGVVYLGYPSCPWCQAYVKYLNEVAKDTGIEEIYYYDIKEARNNNTEEYQKIVSILGENLQYDEEGNHRVYVPNVTFVIEGEIIGNDYESSKDTHGFSDPKDYWTEEEVSQLKSTLSSYMQEVQAALSTCTECNE